MTNATSTTILVHASFEATHNYPIAPEAVRFLQAEHHHQFVVEAEIEVAHEDRELEFILVARWLEGKVFPAIGWMDFASELQHGGTQRLGSKSCEALAREIGEAIFQQYGHDRWLRVTVREDGGHGGAVQWSNDNDND